MKMGDVADFSNFVGAVIDASSFATQKEAIEEAKAAGGRRRSSPAAAYDDSDGWFVQPTVIETTDPGFRTMQEELFGPVVTAFVYDDSRYDDTLDLVDQRHAVRAHRRGLRARPRRDRHGARRGCATPPATSTSTTSRPEPSSASSRSAARARPARTTRPARCGT